MSNEFINRFYRKQFIQINDEKILFQLGTSAYFLRSQLSNGFHFCKALVGGLKPLQCVTVAFLEFLFT